MIHIGVTGTRSGMTLEQRKQVEAIFANCPLGSLAVHHGDCVGVDVEFAGIAKLYGCHTICHPPTENKLRAWHTSDEVLPPKSYFARNRDIVDACSMLIVVPYQTEWSSNGGTWYTHDYAKKKGVPIKIIWKVGREH